MSVHPLFSASMATVMCTAGVFLVSSWAASDSRPGRSQETVKLPQPLYDGTVSIEKTLRERRSVRNYKKAPLAVAEVSQLLWAAQGISASGGRRTAPSAGALYPLEVYVVIGNVAGLSPGIYRYDPYRHELAAVTDGDRRAELCNAALGQSPIKNAAAVLVFSAVYERTTGKYGDRGIRYVHMEAGHAAQNVYLQAVALDIGTVVIGAFDDSAVKKIMHMEERERPLYIMPVGKK